MFNKILVYEALKYCLAHDANQNTPVRSGPGQDSLISLLIHDIFGGEILKTHIKRRWHFYNRIEGKRIDFTAPDINKIPDDIQFEDIPSSPGETHYYFEDEEYSTFLMRFIPAFEEVVGLEEYSPRMTA
jgi:hypothetical protein